MSVKYCKLIEQRNDLINFIREKELERIETDIFNLDKLAPLYEILEKIDMELLKEAMQNDM